jgi:hypothetical protein
MLVFKGIEVTFQNGGPVYRKGNNTIEIAAGTSEDKWKINGILHRIDGPARTILIFGRKYLNWYDHGKLHRVDGPARICYRYDDNNDDFYQGWHTHDKLHRLNGPALTSDTFMYWYIHGIEYTFMQFMQRKIRSKVIALVRLMQGNTGMPGTMVWAEGMGRFHRNRGFGLGLGPDIRKTFIGIDREGEYESEYSNCHLYFIAKGMGLAATMEMPREELILLCSGK